MSIPPEKVGFYPMLSSTEEPVMGFFNGRAWEASKYATAYQRWLVESNKFDMWNDYNGDDIP